MRSTIIIIIFFILLAVSATAWWKFFDYAPFVGQIYYFCSRSNVEYVIITDTKTIAVHVDPTGRPVTCPLPTP